MAHARTSAQSKSPLFIGLAGLVIGLFMGLTLANFQGSSGQAFTYTSDVLKERQKECERLGGDWTATGPSGSDAFDGGECRQGTQITEFDERGFIVD